MAREFCHYPEQYDVNLKALENENDEKDGFFQSKKCSSIHFSTYNLNSNYEIGRASCRERV